MHACYIRTHTCTHTHIHMHAYARLYVYIILTSAETSYIRIYTYTGIFYIDMHMYVCISAFERICLYEHSIHGPCTGTRRHVYIPTNVFMYIDACEGDSGKSFQCVHSLISKPLGPVHTPSALKILHRFCCRQHQLAANLVMEAPLGPLCCGRHSGVSTSN